jgi:hypothetical protein
MTVKHNYIAFLISNFRRVLNLVYSGASVYEGPCLRTIRFPNKFSEQKTPRVTNGVSDNEHNLATAAN